MKSKRDWKGSLGREVKNISRVTVSTVLGGVIVAAITTTGALLYFKGLGNKLRTIAMIEVPLFVVVLLSLAVVAMALMLWLANKKHLRQKEDAEERIA